MTAADEAIRAVAEEMGVADTFVPTPVGVFFGEPELKSATRSSGRRPTRKGCTQCGECMTAAVMAPRTPC